MPYDIYSYSRGSEAFPHEPTADQWFSESQFESYRALGFEITETTAIHDLKRATERLGKLARADDAAWGTAAA